MTVLFMSAKTINNKNCFISHKILKFFNYHLLIGVKMVYLNYQIAPHLALLVRAFFLPIFKPLLLHKFNSAVPFRLCVNSYIIKYIVY